MTALEQLAANAFTSRFLALASRHQDDLRQMMQRQAAAEGHAPKRRPKAPVVKTPLGPPKTPARVAMDALIAEGVTDPRDLTQRAGGDSQLAYRALRAAGIEPEMVSKRRAA